MRNLSLFFIAILFASSCSDKSAIPRDVLPKEKMAAVLWSMITAGEYFNAFLLKDSIDKVAETSKLYGEVFQIHHISREEFEKSFAYYKQHSDLMKIILDTLSKRQTYDVERFQRRQDSLRKTAIKGTDRE